MSRKIVYKDNELYIFKYDGPVDNGYVMLVGDDIDEHKIVVSAANSLKDCVNDGLDFANRIKEKLYTIRGTRLDT